MFRVASFPVRAAFAAAAVAVSSFALGGCAMKMPSFGADSKERTGSLPSKQYATGQQDDGLPPANSGTYRPASPWVWDHNSSGTREIIVRPGESLHGIATRHRVAISEIMAANRMSSPVVTPGQRLLVPVDRQSAAGRTGGAAYAPSRSPQGQTALRRQAYAVPPQQTYAAAPLRPAPSQAPPPAYTFERSQQPLSLGAGQPSGSYTVRPGDTLYGIARTTGVSAGKLAYHNRITNPSHIGVGTVLQIPRN